MEWWQALILGVVQGLTEFLPISSSGHLIVAQEMLGVETSNAALDAFDVALHLGTLSAVFAFYRRDLWNLTVAGLRSLRLRRVEGLEERLAWFIVIGTFPAILFYLVAGDLIQSAQDNFVLIGIMLIAVCGYFFLADWKGGKGELETLTLPKAILIGIGQAAALIPGTSRSGATIATGMLMGLDRAAAARFSFLLSTPAILAATVLTLPDLANAGSESTSFLVATMVGTVAAGVSGYLAIASLIRFLGNHALSWFAVYRIPVGIALLAYYAL